MIANKFGFPSPKIGTTQRRSAWPQIQRRHARIEKRATSLINAMLVYRKEVATVSQPPFPTVPPAGLPTASTVGAKATVRASVDTRVVSGAEGAEGGEMRGATGYVHVAFFLAPRHPPWFVWLCLGRSQWWWKRRGVLRHAYAWPATAFHSRFPADREGEHAV